MIDTPQIFLSADQIDLVAVERSTTPITKLVSVAERHRRNVDFGASIVSNSTWLRVSLDTTVTPAMMTLTADPTGLDPSPRGDSVVVTSAEGGSDTVAVTLGISQGPAIALSPDTVWFTMARTGPLPDAQVITIENDSSGTLTGLAVALTLPPWLIADPLSSTTAPAEFTLWVDSTGFTPGTDTTEVVVTRSGGGDRTVTAVFTMTQGPALSVSSDLVEFYAVQGQPVPAAQSVSISNGGDGTLDGVVASSSEAWLDVTLAGPSSAPVELALTPNAAAAALPPGLHTATVACSSGVASNTPINITVQYHVALVGVPNIALSPDSVRFAAVQNGPLPDERVVEIENVGGGTLDNLDVDQVILPGWLQATLSSTTAPANLTLAANTTGQTAGTIAGFVVITFDTPTRRDSIPVVLTMLPAPTIEFSTDLVRFRGIEGQGQRPDLAVAVTNGSNGLLTLVPPPVRPGWLQSAVLQDSTAPTELTLRFDTNLPTLPADSSTVSVVSTVASNSPAALAVEYRVDPYVAPLAAFSPDTVRFTSVFTEGPPSDRIIEIRNTGGDALVVSDVASSEPTWLSAQLEPVADPTPIRLQVIADLDPGFYTAELTVTSNSNPSPGPVPVEYTVLQGPQIAPSVDTVTFREAAGDFTETLDLLISNAGAGILSGLTATVGSNSWLTVSAQSDQFIRLTVEDPPAADTAATVTLGSSVAGVGDNTILVAVERLPTTVPASIGLSSNAVDFTVTQTVDTGSQVVRIENLGGGSVDDLVAVSSSPLGLTASLSGGPSAPAFLALTVDPTTLTPGPHSVEIQSSSAPFVTLPVQFTLLPGPELALSSDAVTFYADSRQALPVAQAIAVSNRSGGILTDIQVTSSPPTWLNTVREDTTAPTVVTINPTTTELLPGTYPHTVVITDDSASNSPATIDVTYVVGPPAVIGTSSDSIHFTTAQYEPVPTDHVLMIENIGGGMLDGLDVSMDPDASAWLDTTLSGNTAPATLSLTVIATDLTPNTRITDLIISSSVAEPDTIPVSFTVLPGPQLAVSSDTVRFYSGFRQGGRPAAQVVAVSNGSAGTLSGIIVSSSETWLDATPASPGSAPAEITLRPKRRFPGLVVGTNNATVSISSPVSSTSAVITVEYILDPGAEIALSTNAVQFVATPTDPDPAQREVVIENAGTGTLDSLEVNPTTLPGWLQASITPTIAPATLSLTANPAALAPGNSETANLEIISPAADTVVLPVTFTVLPGPSISASASELTFRAVSGQDPPGTQTVTVLNGAGGTLTGVYVDPASIPLWLDATPKIPTAAPTAIEVWPTTTALAAGDSVVTLRIMSDVASNSPTDVVVTYKVAPGPVLAASPTEVQMTGVSGSSETDVQTVLLENISAGTLGGLTVGNTPSWLSTSLNTTDAPAILTLTADPAALPVDTVSHTVTVSSPDAANTADIAVTFVVSEPTTLSLSPQTVVFNSIAGEATVPEAQTVSIINAGSGQLRDIAVAANQSWLTLSLDTSSVPATVTLQPNQVLESRSAPYTADIEVLSSTAVNSPRIAYVEYFVQPPAGPVISLSPQTLTFARDNPPAQTVNITNGGSGTLRDLAVEVTYQGGNDWLFVLLDTRVAPAKLTVALVAQNAAGAPANAEAILRISGEGAAEQEVTVRLP